MDAVFYHFKNTSGDVFNLFELDCSSLDSLSIRSPLDVSTIELQQNTHTVESSLWEWIPSYRVWLVKTPEANTVVNLLLTRTVGSVDTEKQALGKFLRNLIGRL